MNNIEQLKSKLAAAGFEVGIAPTPPEPAKTDDGCICKFESASGVTGGCCSAFNLQGLDPSNDVHNLFKDMASFLNNHPVAKTIGPGAVTTVASLAAIAIRAQNKNPIVGLLQAANDQSFTKEILLISKEYDEIDNLLVHQG